MKNIKVLIVTIAAKNIHKALAPWCLKAYCDQLELDCNIAIQENNINDKKGDIISGIYECSPDVAAFSCYIWNIEMVCQIAKEIKKILPSCRIVLGGPEVSFEEPMDNYRFADYIIQGAGEVSFYNLLKSLENGGETEERIVKGGNEDFSEFPSPYTDEFFASFTASKMSSIENQLVYYESSRGCPFSCAYCLSSTTHGVQYLPLERVMQDLQKIIAHGAKCLKFVDRTFNADKKRAFAILEYIYSLDTTCTFHFEAAADLFDEALLEIVSKMPVGRVQFEIGIQSVNARTLEAVCRKTDIDKALANIKRLTDMSNCHIHVDLIAGLPFETIETFAEGINRCLAVNPHMLQLGFLKMLKGSAIRGQSFEYEYLYTEYAPYEVMKSHCLSIENIVTLKGIEEVIDKFYNSGMFVNTVQYALNKLFATAYGFFAALSVYCKNKGNIKVSLKNSYALLMDFLFLYSPKSEAEHFIKLDCLSYDVKGMLPDGIVQYRDKKAESEYKKESSFKNCRIEYFSYDNKKRLFIYDAKNPISKVYSVIELD